jgi:hypothetical protein
VNADLKKQLIDQPLHVLMGLASVNGIGAVLLCASGIGILLSTVIATLLTMTWEGLREFFQYPPRVWWDLWLDAAFEVLGIVGGAALFYFVTGPWISLLGWFR